MVTTFIAQADTRKLRNGGLKGKLPLHTVGRHETEATPSCGDRCSLRTCPVLVDSPVLIWLNSSHGTPRFYSPHFEEEAKSSPRRVRRGRHGRVGDMDASLAGANRGGQGLPLLPTGPRPEQVDLPMPARQCFS